MRRLAVLALLVGTLFGCSSEDRRGQFVEEATEICEASKREIDVAFGATLTGSSTPEQVAFFLERTLVPLLRERLEALRQLELPSDDREELQSMFDDYEAVVDDIAADPAGFVPRADPFEAIDARLDEYGLPACGSAPPSGD